MTTPLFDDAADRRVQESGVVGHTATTDDLLGEVDIYEGLINPHDGSGGKGQGAGGSPMMMPPMGAGGGGGAAGGAPGMGGGGMNVAGMSAAGRVGGTAAAGLGGGARTEVGRQDREGRASNGTCHENDRDPGEDDHAPTTHHETREAPHHAATRSLEPATIETVACSVRCHRA